jgi:hypothetical protein
MSLARPFLVLCVMFSLIVGINAFYVLPKISEQIEANGRTTEGVCALRADLERRVAAGTAFLQKHPTGAFGFKPREIRESVDNQQRTVTALGDLDCSKPR